MVVLIYIGVWIYILILRFFIIEAYCYIYVNIRGNFILTDAIVKR